MRQLRCFFCRSFTIPNRLVDYRVGTTGKRGQYRRRICIECEPKHVKNIRTAWTKR